MDSNSSPIWIINKCKKINLFLAYLNHILNIKFNNIVISFINASSNLGLHSLI